MLTIIEPKDHRTYQRRIDSFLSLLRIYQNFSPSPEEVREGTFIIGADDEYGVYGGALLLKKNIGDLERRIRQIVLTFHPDADALWVGQIGFYRGPEGVFATAKTMEGYFDFYRGLLKSFNTFGNNQETSFLCLTLNLIEYVKLKNYGFWGNVGEVLPQDSSDTLFHGILSLDWRGQ